MKIIGSFIVFFLLSFSLQAQTQSKKDSMNAELKQLEHYEGELKIRIDKLNQSILHHDKLFREVNDKMRLLDKTLRTQKNDLDTLEKTKPQTAEIKKSIKQLRKDHADVSNEINRGMADIMRIGKDRDETRSDLQKAEELLKEIRTGISDIKKQLR